jgi:hypothetical protein
VTFDRRQSVLAEVKKQFPEYACFFGFDYIDALRGTMAKQKPFIFVDHAYFGRGYEARNFRVILSDIHQRQLVKRDKAKGFRYEGRDWKKGEHILIFPPSPTIATLFGAQNWVEQVKAGLRDHTDRMLVVKHKHATDPLKHFLKNAHAVIGYGTVATVEAALYGVPVFTGPRCPATPIGIRDPALIESPIFPDREPWFNSLTNSQFHIDEIRSGLCRETVLGNELDRPSEPG